MVNRGSFCIYNKHTRFKSKYIKTVHRLDDKLKLNAIYYFNIKQ